MAWVYKQTESRLWTVGFYDPDGRWHPDSDHDSDESAAQRVYWLNGGSAAEGATLNTTTTTTTEDPTEIGWAIVEMLGRRRIAGHVSEVTIAGAGFLRVESPGTLAGAARTQLLSPGSVYAIHPVDEQAARAVAEASYVAPVQRWELPARGDRDDPALDIGPHPGDEGPF